MLQAEIHQQAEIFCNLDTPCHWWLAFGAIRFDSSPSLVILNSFANDSGCCSLPEDRYWRFRKCNALFHVVTDTKIEDWYTADLIVAKDRMHHFSPEVLYYL